MRIAVLSLRNAGGSGAEGSAPPALLLLGLYCLLPVAGLINGPLYAPAVFAVAVLIALWQRRVPAPDRPLALLALLFVALSWLGLAWSISPPRTVSGALQISVVFPAALAFLAAGKTFPAGRAPALAAGMTAAFLAGTLLLLSERLDHFALLHALDGPKVWPTKYNRGIDYFCLILLPTLGFTAAQQRWRLAAALCVAVCIAVAAGRNTTAQIALPGAALTIFAGAYAPRLTARLLAAATAAEALFLPFAMRLVTHYRPLIAPHIKLSAVERLEIWDYLSAHVLQRPILGWGLWASRLLPATPEEMAHFIKAQGSGIYPHNQFLELWVESGLPGVLLGLAFALLVLRRAAQLPPALRPFGYAAFVVALAIASSGFEITTDSWWAALAASGALFSLFARAAMQASRISAEAIPPAPPAHPGTTHLRADAPAPRRNRQAWRPRVPGGR